MKPFLFHYNTHMKLLKRIETALWKRHRQSIKLTNEKFRVKRVDEAGRVFYKLLAKQATPEWIDKGLINFLESKKIEHGISFVCSTDTLVKEAFKAGIQYAFNAQVEDE